MADDLQSLLDRISREGLQQAEEEKQRILDNARREADEIVSSARDQAREILETARAEAARLEAQGREALRQAARDVLLSLRRQLETSLQNVVKTTVSQALTPELMGGIIAEIAKAYTASGMEIERIEALLDKERLEQIRSGLLAALAEDLRTKTEFPPLPGRQAGFQLRFNGEDVLYDFSDEALTEALCEFLNPKLAALLKSEEKTAVPNSPAKQ